MRRSIAATLFAPLLSWSAMATPLSVYMAPDGNDANDGLSLSTPVLTLQRVQVIVRKIDPQDEVTVNIAGTITTPYYGESVTWFYVMASHHVSFIGAGNPDDLINIPVFDGCIDGTLTNCPTNRWFTLSTSAENGLGGKPSNIVLSHIALQHYLNPIWLAGDPDEFLTGWNGYNTIENMLFRRIGTEYFTPTGAQAGNQTWGVVSLYNSVYDVLANNRFQNICNVSGNVYLHAYYLGNNASNGTFGNDSFYNVCGDTVRFRDASNFNTMSNERFLKTGKDAPITSWFCRADPQTCQHDNPECPSHDNVVANSYYDGSHACKQTPFQKNLYGIRACGVSRKKQKVTLTNDTTNFPMCGQETH